MTAAFELTLERLALAVRNGAHAFFLSCPDDSLSLELARGASVAVLSSDSAASVCHNPDYYEYEGRSMSISDARALIAELAARPKAGHGRSVVILHAEATDVRVQNALLKSVEEPPEGTAFFFLGNADGALPTIISRCLVMRLGLPGREAVRGRLVSLGADGRTASVLSSASGGSTALGEALYCDEALRAFRGDAIAAFLGLCAGDMPLSAARQLSQDAPAAVGFMLSAARDMLMGRFVTSGFENPDYADELSRAASRFTTGKLTCIIETLGEASRMLTGVQRNAFYDKALLNRLFLDISEVIDR